MLSGLINTTEQRTLALDQIRRDGGTQPRDGIDWEHVKEMQHALANGDTLPAVDVIYDGTDYWLWDGFHRFHAYANVGKLEIPVVIQQGTQDDAQWQSFAANRNHGLKRTTADKERAIRAALKHPKSAGLSNLAIARHLGVDDKTVGKYREEMELSSEIPKIDERIVKRNGQTYTQNTANIGANRPPPAPAQRMTEQYTITPIVHGVVRQRNVSAADLRMTASNRSGAIWQECLAAVPAGQWLAHRDLAQALNNVAYDMELRAAHEAAKAAWVAAPVVGHVSNVTEPAIQEAPHDRPLPAWAADESPAGDALEETLRTHFSAPLPTTATDPWLTAATAPVRRHERAALLADALQPWIREYNDEHGRDWKHLAEYGNPSHTNSTFWRDIKKECERRNVGIGDEMLKFAIKQAFATMLAQHQAEALAAAPRPSPLAPSVADPAEALPVSQRADYESDEWYTPAEYIAAARGVMGTIDLDPASSELAQTVVQAGVYLTRFDDGLNQARWLHQRIWLNPPYSNPGPWIEKLIREHQSGPFCTEAIVLVNNATETTWFQALLQRYPVCFPSKRLAFWRHDHANVGARQGQAFFYLGPDAARFQQVFSQFGPILKVIAL